MKKVGAGMIFTCIIEDITEDLSPPPDIRWRGPTGSEITATVGRFVFNNDKIISVILIPKELIRIVTKVK